MEQRLYVITKYKGPLIVHIPEVLVFVAYPQVYLLSYYNPQGFNFCCRIHRPILAIHFCKIYMAYQLIWQHTIEGGGGGTMSFNMLLTQMKYRYECGLAPAELKTVFVFLCIFFGQARVCWPLLCICRPFMGFF
jgi:hypothetical protein